MDPPLGTRLRAWWDGEEPAPRRRSAGSGPRAVERDAGSLTPTAPAPEEGWSDARREVVQTLWGPGFIWPGGESYVFDLVNGFGLNPAVTMLELGAGMGGGTCAVVEKFGNYVTGLERDAALVAEAAKLATVHGVDDKASVAQFDPARLNLKERYYEAALVREVLYTVEDKQDLVEHVIRSLKPEAQIVFTDFLFGAEADGAALESWKASQPVPVYPWSINDYKRIFAAGNVVMRITADESDDYRAQVLAGWTNLLRKMRARDASPDMTLPLLQEAELWAHRLAAIESGDLRYYRIVGIKNS